jgi:hypothetical protein
MGWLLFVFGGLVILGYSFLGVGWLVTHELRYVILGLVLLVVIIALTVTIHLYRRRRRTKK